MTDLNSFLKSAQKILQDISFDCIAHDIWGSQNPAHRDLIHTKVQELKSISAQVYTSISHSEGMGLVASSTHPVGADIELTARVLNKIIARVSTHEELSIAPSPASLWCAKEACFKALKNFKQPSVLSQISIGDWQKIDSQTETCRLMNFQDFQSSSENRGVVMRSGQYTVCFFIFPT